MIDKFFTVVGAVPAAYGLIGLAGIWLVPAIGRSRLYGSAMLTGSLAPTRVNRTVSALSCVLAGACLASMSLGHRTAIIVFILAILLLTSARAIIWYRLRR